MKLKVNLSSGKACAKCGTPVGPIFRHHMGNDAFLGKFNKRISFNYQKFLDCVYLCLDHHCEIHYLYDTLILKFWVDRTPNGAWRIRQKCIKFCQRWLIGRIPSPTVPAEYRKLFAKNFEAYKEAADATTELVDGRT